MDGAIPLYAAIRKMLRTLDDPFTRFLEPEKFSTLRSGTRGAVTGVGLEVGFETNGVDANLVVIAPVIGGPAQRAGIVPGDIISNIDGLSTYGIGLYDAAQRLQGPEGSEVKLTVRNKQAGSSNTITLTREKIQINPVSWRLCKVAEEGRDPVKIGYIRLATFNENATRSVKDAVLKLKETGATAFILDMRNNSGGLFPAGIEIAKMWCLEAHSFEGKLCCSYATTANARLKPLLQQGQRDNQPFQHGLSYCI